MEDKATVQDTTPQALIESYLETVKTKDAALCADYFADDASLHFMTGVFKGRQAIEKWHQDRFEAEAEVLKVKKIVADGNKVTVDAVVTSKKLRAWKISKLAGKATVKIQDGKVKEVKLSPRLYNPFEGW